ncbi:MAG: hypothetical protein EA403_11490 [Spirochaetaceae bacterium]|nr:MAG: hypothetical protein EA403_11490 [Spirochaetaceae bacterium]
MTDSRNQKPSQRIPHLHTKGLRQADRLFRSGRYADVIRLLEPQVFLYREDPTYYYLLGTSCLLTGDAGGAFSYLSRSSHIGSDSVEILLALAATQVRRHREDEALQLWLDVLEHDPRNRIAKRGLALLRGAASPAALAEATDGERIQRFLPRFRRPVPKRAVIAAAVLCVGIAGVLLAPLVRDRLTREMDPVDPRDGVELTLIGGDTGSLTEFEGRFRVMLTEAEIRESFRQMGEAFNSFRDNLAVREINRILNSNASTELKRRAALLRDYTRTPTFLTFQDNATFAQVARDPWLFADSYVRWSGRISNLDITEHEIRFDLLVGYETERVLEGVAPMRMRFAARLSPAMSVEVIGRVVVEENRIRMIEVTSIRPIVPES